MIKETEDGKKVCYTGFEAETSYTYFPQEYYMEMKSYFENEYVPDGDNTVLVKLEFLDEACTIFLVEEDSAYTYEESYADFIDDFGTKNGMHHSCSCPQRPTCMGARRDSMLSNVSMNADSSPIRRAAAVVLRIRSHTN